MDKKLIIIIVLVVLILLAGGAAGLVLVLMKSDSAAEYKLSSPNATIEEGSTWLIDLKTSKNISNDTILYYNITGDNVTQNDFKPNTLAKTNTSGITVNNFPLIFHLQDEKPLIQDGSPESNEKMDFTLYGDPNFFFGLGKISVTVTDSGKRTINIDYAKPRLRPDRPSSDVHMSWFLTGTDRDGALEGRDNDITQSVKVKRGDKLIFNKYPAGLEGGSYVDKRLNITHIEGYDNYASWPPQAGTPVYEEGPDTDHITPDGIGIMSGTITWDIPDHVVGTYYYNMNTSTQAEGGPWGNESVLSGIIQVEN